MKGYDPLNEYPGEFEPKSLANEYHLEGGVRDAPENDYIEASACGLGKSKAAWASIDSTQSVLCVSYRRTFSKSQGKLHNCDLYSDFPGVIKMKAGRRVMCQLESLHRVQGAPKVLIIDELHGIFRQASSSGGVIKAQAWHELERLIKESGRVIVLDAEANDEDVRLLSGIRGADFVLERNTFKPHSNKTVYTYEKYANYLKPALEEFLRRRRTDFPRGPDGATPDARMQSKFVIITHTPGDVALFSKLLKEYDVKHQAYSSETKPELKNLHFDDPVKHWADLEAIIYNSTLEAGVSIEGPEWKTAWCKFTGYGAVEASMQMLHRFRAVENYHITASKHKGANKDFFPTTREGITEHIKLHGKFLNDADIPKPTVVAKANAKEDSLFKFVKDYVLLGGKPEAIPFTQMWFTTQLEANRSARYWPRRFYKMLESTGFNIKESEPTLEPTIVPPKCLENAVDCTIFKESFAKQIADASVEPYLELVAQSEGADHVQVKTTAQQPGRERFLLDSEYGENPNTNEEYVKKFRSKKVVHAHRNMRRLKGYGKATSSEAVDYDLEMERRKTGMAPKISSDAWRNRLVLDALNAIGFDQMDSKDEVSIAELREKLDANLISPAIKALHDNRRLWRDCGVTPLRTQATSFRSHLGAIGTIIQAQCGIQLISTQKEAKCTHLVLKQTKWNDQLMDGEWTDPLPEKTQPPPPKLPAKPSEPPSERNEAILLEQDYDFVLENL